MNLTIKYGDRTIPCRPHSRSEEVIKDTLESILPELKGYFGHEYSDSICDEVLDVFSSKGVNDSYSIVKELDNKYHWDVTYELIGIFEKLRYNKILHALEEKWLKDNKIEPLYKVGDKINVRMPNGLEPGTIDEIISNDHMMVGRYIVKVGEDSWGHTVIRWEDAIPVDIQA